MAGSAARGTPAGNTLTTFGTPGGAAGMASAIFGNRPAASSGGGKGGTANVVPPAAATPAPAAQYAPMAPQGGFNVNQASASALQQALGGTQRAIGGTGLFTNYVTNQTLSDLERQRQMQQNATGAEATRAGAFGGSRHGVADALTNEAFARTGAQTFGNLQLGQQQAQMQGAAQLGQLGQQAFNTGQAIQQQQMQQGLMQQGLQQALIDSARGQYAGYVGAPNAALQAPLAALGVTPTPQTTTQSKNPGLFDYLSLGASAYAASDSRLKTNVRPLDKVGNVSFYAWDWNDEGKKIADPAQPTFGVIADELQETHPHLVERGEDGYLRVNYKGLMSELEAA